MTTLTAVQLPIPWEAFGLPALLQTRTTCLMAGPPAWAWEPEGPDLGIARVDAVGGEVAPEWLVRPDGARPGDAILITKGIAVEGTAIIAREVNGINNATTKRPKQGR